MDLIKHFFLGNSVVTDKKMELESHNTRKILLYLKCAPVRISFGNLVTRAHLTVANEIRFC